MRLSMFVESPYENEPSTYESPFGFPSVHEQREQMWSTLDSIFSKLIKVNKEKLEDQVIQIIQDCLNPDINPCFISLDLTWDYIKDKRYLISFLQWTTVQLFRAELYIKSLSTRKKIKGCQSLMFKVLVPVDALIFNIILSDYIEITKELVDYYKRSSRGLHRIKVYDNIWYEPASLNYKARTLTIQSKLECKFLLSSVLTVLSTIGGEISTYSKRHFKFITDLLFEMASVFSCDLKAKTFFVIANIISTTTSSEEILDWKTLSFQLTQVLHHFKKFSQFMKFSSSVVVLSRRRSKKKDGTDSRFNDLLMEIVLKTIVTHLQHDKIVHKNVKKLCENAVLLMDYVPLSAKATSLIIHIANYPQYYQFTFKIFEKEILSSVEQLFCKLEEKQGETIGSINDEHERKRIILQSSSSLWAKFSRIIKRILKFLDHGRNAQKRIICTEILYTIMRFRLKLHFKLKNMCPHYFLLEEENNMLITLVMRMCKEELTAKRSTLAVFATLFALMLPSHKASRIFLLSSWTNRSFSQWKGPPYKLCFQSLIFGLVTSETSKGNITIQVLKKLLCHVKHSILYQKFIEMILILIKLAQNKEIIIYLKKCLGKIFRSDSIKILLLSPIMGKYLPCLVADCCILERTDILEWNIECIDCDEVKPRKKRKRSKHLDCFLNIVGLKYRDLLSESSAETKLILIRNLMRYMQHSYVLKTLFVMKQLIKMLNCRFSRLHCVFLNSINAFLYNNGSIYTLGVLTIVQAIIRLLKKVIVDGDFGWIPFILRTIVKIADMSTEWSFFISIKILFFISPLVAQVSDSALNELLGNITHAGKSFKQSQLILYQEDLSKVWTSSLVMNNQIRKHGMYYAVSVIARFLKLPVRKFLELYCTSSLVSYAITSFNREVALNVLNEISKIFDMPLKDLLIIYFEDTFTSVYFHQEWEKLNQFLQFIVDQTQETLGAVVYFSYKSLICKVLTYSCDPKVVHFIATEMIQNKSPDGLFNIVKVLQKHVLGYLTYLDSKLVSQRSSELTLRQCLSSLSHVMSLIGPEGVTMTRLKFMDTLRTGLPPHNERFPKLVLQAWSNFIYSVNLTLIGPFLSTVIISLLPLIERFPKHVSYLLYYLVVQNEEIFTDFIPELHFIPKSSNPVMLKVWSTIQNYLQIISHSYETDIGATLKYIRNENTQLRVHALNYLHKKLNIHSKAIHEAILQNDKLDPTVVELIDCLMLNMQESNVDLQVACAKCIGELGAIDPSRIENRMKEMVSQKLSLVGLETEGFAFLCINELVRGLQNADNPLEVNTFASGIQELLKLYFEGKPELVADFQNRFPTHIRTVLESLMVSRYRYMVSHFRDEYPFPIFGSSLGKTTFEWAYTWATEMIMLMEEKSFSKRLFTICSPSMRVDMQTLLVLLPYIFLEAVLKSTKVQLKVIQCEMKSVLSWKLRNKENSDFEIETLRFYTDKIELNPNSNVLKHGLDEMKRVSIVCDLINFLQRNIIGENRLTSEEKIIVVDFLKDFPERPLSYTSYLQKEYYRALFYLEKDAVKNMKERSCSCLRPLRTIYSKLNDPDGLLGVMRTASNVSSIEDMVLNHVVCGNLEDAVTGYEYLAEKYGSNEFHRGLVQCYLNMDQPYIALQVIKSLFQQSSRIQPVLYNECIEVLWNNILIDDLESELSRLDSSMKDNWCWGVDVGCVINLCTEGDKIKMDLKLREMRQHLIGNLTVICDNTLALYRQGYSHIVKLHILNEFEKYAVVMDSLPELTDQTFEEVLGAGLDLRLRILSQKDNILQRVLTMRRVYLKFLQCRAKSLNPPILSSIEKQIGKISLISSKLARRSGNFHKSHAMIEVAEQYCPVGSFIERAKLLQTKGEIPAAVLILEQGINQFFPNNKTVIYGNVHIEMKMLCAEAKLLLAKYNDESTSVDFDEGYMFYKGAVDIFSWEKGFVFFAQYLYKICVANDMSDFTQVQRDLQLVAASYFGKSLQYGAHFIYQSMPCMLSLWFDFGSRLATDRERSKAAQSEQQRTLTLQRFNLLLDVLRQKLPTYFFMTAFSQLLSRMCHPERSCFEILRKIIVDIITSFPQQAMWMFITILKSSHPEHKLRTEAILQHSDIKKNGKILSFVTAFDELACKLIELCQRKLTSNKESSLRTICKGLPKKIKDYPFVMVPCQKFRTILLPNYVQNGRKTQDIKHEPFPTSLVYIADIKNEVEILRSMQRPKKVVIIGSDGLQYALMFKNMDDLRLDARIMEFNSIVNMYLRRDAKSRDRCLHIRTYSVVPLNNKCGLIEWIPNLMPFRRILMELYKGMGVGMTMKEIKLQMTGQPKSLSAKMKLLTELLLPKHPPVFHEFFFTNFLSPESWYRGRLCYMRTAAVMSIVGYVVGLGDRHGENILFDILCGDTVHVDFNCVFNKGETFEFPEVVPFRLTHNMVKAMGPTGIEGPFVRSCEITTRVMRNHEDELTAVIKPFLYDPEGVSRSFCRRSEFKEETNETARCHIKRVERRLKGMVHYTIEGSQALSVEGQVRNLIEEATNLNNLCQMFFGWAPFL